MIVVVVYRDTTDDCPKKSLKNIFESVTQSKHDLSMNPNSERQNCSIKPPTLMDFTGVANAQGPPFNCIQVSIVQFDNCDRN